MGQCMKKSTVKLTTASVTQLDVKTSLIERRANLVSEIHKLHMVNLSCNEGIETCLINSKKSLLMLLKLKQEYLKFRMRTMQELVKVIDDSIDAIGIRMTKKREIIEQADKTLSSSNVALESDNVKLITENNNDVISDIEQELKFQNVCSREKIETEVENALNDVSNGSRNPHRRRYSKKHRSTLV